jgi:hypothetical protein
MANYQERKEQLRQKAIEWQHETSENAMSWQEIAQATDYFYKQAKRVGLVRELKREGII